MSKVAVMSCRTVPFELLIATFATDEVSECESVAVQPSPAVPDSDSPEPAATAAT